MVACGYTNRQVERVLDRGEARRLHRGVYLLGPILSVHAQAMAAGLACGPSALVSHYAGACLCKLLPLPAQFDAVDITVTSGRVETQPGIRVHRTTWLRPHERRERDGIPVTAPLRTLIDLASSCTVRELEGAIAEAFALGLVNKRMLERAVENARGRRGVARIRALIGTDRRPSRTRSNPERALLHLLRAARIDGFETNVRIGRWEVDFYWRDLGLVVEVDAYATHSSPWAFERDRRKTTDLEDRGLKVHRVTDIQIEREPKPVVAQIQRRLRDLTAELRRNHRTGG
jgi:very-short-patch-repair endonuclease